MKKGIGTFVCLDCSKPKKCLFSKRCCSCVAKARVMSLETREKISLASKGKHSRLGLKNSPEHIRKSALAMVGNKYALGHHWKLSEKTKEKMKIWALLRFSVPKNNPAWQGGKSFEVYPKEFSEELREKIRERDNRTCQLCGEKERDRKAKKRHPVHHIDYNKKHNWKNNLMELCSGCNTKVNANRKHWREYFRWIRVGEYLSPYSIVKVSLCK